MTTILPRTQEKVLDTGYQYRIRNNTDSRLTTADGRTDLLRWNRVAYRLEAGEDTIVPWAVIACYFGDPRSQPDKILQAEDSQGKHTVPARGNELLRLSVFYGTYEHGVETLAAVVPDVTISTLDGVEIIPPCFDPDGEYIYGFHHSEQNSQDVAVMIHTLQAQVKALEARQARMAETGDNDGDIPQDNPQFP